MRQRLAIIALAVTIVIGLPSACAIRWWLDQPLFNDAYVAEEILAEVRPGSLAEWLDYEDSYVTCNDAEDNDPALSWDGNKLAFASDRDGDWDIFLLRRTSAQRWRTPSTPPSVS